MVPNFVLPHADFQWAFASLVVTKRLVDVVPRHDDRRRKVCSRIIIDSLGYRENAGDAVDV